MSEPAPNAAPPPPDPLAVALSKLDPAPHGFDRDALMFAAGQSSKLGVLAFWKWTAGVAAAAAIVFAGLYFFTPPKVKFAEPPALRSTK
ncbi:MAG TPA: hypothetical protein VM529_24750 [Gemmata sp.]|nr:hypothetical protein [Gemmata sp.]